LAHAQLHLHSHNPQHLIFFFLLKKLVNVMVFRLTQKIFFPSFFKTAKQKIEATKKEAGVNAKHMVLLACLYHDLNIIND